MLIQENIPPLGFNVSGSFIISNRTIGSAINKMKMKKYSTRINFLKTFFVFACP